ncbi:MAG: ABC transporter ATP-binding protein/permease [bacterium]|nr:ABC transporter ATP-binding protein/permease [bacterium]MCM1375097.1 ABC transporter ATP-binding protein/permease [Muribaculum sp.]
MKKVIRNNLYMLNIFFRAVPLYAIGYALLTVGRSILFNTVGNVLFIRYLVKSVEYAIAHPQGAPEVLTRLIAVTCVYYGLVLLLNTVIEGVFNNSLAKNAESRVNHVFTKMMFEKSASIDLGCYDDRKFYSDLIAANSESNDRAWNTYRNFVSLTENFLVLLSLFYLISTLDFVVFVLAVGVNVLSFLHQIRLNRINGEIYDKTLPCMKEIDYANRIFFLKQNAKDIQTTNIGRVLLDKLTSSSQKLSDIHAAYGARKALVCSGDNLMKKILGDFVTLFYLAYTVLVKCAYSFDVMTALWNAYGTVKGNMNNFVNSIRELHRNSIYIEKFLHFMERENRIVSDKGLKIHVNTPITIEFVDVSFSYDGKHRILDGLQLKINANEKVAIVGSNGAGKSTLVKLLLRLYDPDRGKILVNGTDIRDYDVEFYRKSICGILVQNFQLFALTLYENVKMDLVEPQTEGAELDQALYAVGLRDVLECLPDRGDSDYSREFRDGGAVFSGGQKQKLALARVLSGDKRMVVLDEPSSALDPKAESEFNEHVFHMLPERTVVIISHRLSTTKMADRIILLQNGRVAEDGSHGELMKRSGIYAKMFEIQSRRYQ